MNGNRFKPPVEVGDELDVKIEAVGEKGDGIAKKDGFVLFVPNTKEGDNVRIKITKVLRKVGFAEVVGSSESSESGESEAKEEPEQEAKEEPEEDSDYEDSEDFGEEAKEDKEDKEDKEAKEDKEDKEEPEEY